MEAVFNRHIRDFRCDFTIEFDVKFPSIRLEERHEPLMEEEWKSGFLTNEHSQNCFDEIMESDYSFIEDWSFVGRSNGWWVLVCTGDESKVRKSSIHRIEKIVEKYFQSYGKLIVTNFDLWLAEESKDFHEK